MLSSVCSMVRQNERGPSETLFNIGEDHTHSRLLLYTISMQKRLVFVKVFVQFCIGQN